jgi:hypothetical protein
MPKRIIVIGVVLLLAIVAIAAVLLLRPDLKKIDVNRGGNSEQVGSVPQVMTQVFPTEDNDKYTIQVEYPKLQGVSKPGIQEKVNASVQSRVYNQIAGFREANITNLALGDPQMRSAFEAEFDTSLVTPSFFSAIMLYSDYSAGAAHPNNYNVSLNYDLKTGESVTLDKFLQSLKPSAGYMDRLGKYVRADLIRQLGDSQDVIAAIDLGGKPSAESYANFTLDGSGLSIHFDPYQVAPYAAGSPVVEISYVDLMSLVVKSASADSSATSSVKWWL